ncbi:MAG: hypothetical protein Q7R98_01405 [Candidatus Jorgensenbacteria bacterium]|nr:hypothetical protein [Candidatus Jorgensenbacteria bacterium]
MLTLTYLGQRSLYRIAEFFRHWYVKSVRIYSNFIIDMLQALDRHFAWKVTARFLFHPLYGDYTITGYVLGFIFRFFRLIIASVVYAVVFVFAVFCYLVWIAIPPYLLLRPFLGYL